MDNRERSILKTLLYADIFNYPLTKNQVWKFLISEEKINKTFLFNNLKNIKKIIDFKDGYFFLKGKKELIYLRKENEKESSIKLKKAKKIAQIVFYIPSIKLIGVSGALSMKNSDANDDIDFFVVSENNLAWTTRLLSIIILSLLGVYRTRKTQNIKDKICLNMIIDESNLHFKKPVQNLYTAHEVIQIIPLFTRNNTYKKFIKENGWYKKFLPNATSYKNLHMDKSQNIFEILLLVIFKILSIEKILRFLQRKYMEKNVTRETIESGFIALHPFDYKSFVLNNYNKKIKKHLI